MGKITLTNIAEELAEKSKLSKESANGFLHSFIEVIEKGLSKDNVVKIKGLGTFKLMTLSDRGSVDVSTGERITIKGYTKVSFTPDSSMKEFVNRPFAHFEPTELNDGYPEEEMPIDTEETLEDVLPSAVEELEDSITEQVQEVAGIETENENATILDEQDVAGDAEVTDELPETTKIVEVTEVAEGLEIVETSETLETSEILESSEPVEHATPNEPIEEVVEEVIEEFSTESDDFSQGAITASATNVVVEEQEVLVSEEEPAAIEPSVNKVEEDMSTSSKPDALETKGKKRFGRLGIGCLFVLLLLVVVIAAYFTPRFTIDDIKLFEEDKLEVAEQGEIKVNPNLDKELGIRQNNESETSVSVSDTISKTDTEALPEETPAPTNEDTIAPSEAIKSPQPAPETKPVTMPVAQTFVITEALAAKNIKDITVADTTDYSIEGTQASHTLQDGETIIQLSRKYYGDKRLWPYIVKHNNITDFNKVSVGMKVNIPILKYEMAE